MFSNDETKPGTTQGSLWLPVTIRGAEGNNADFKSSPTTAKGSKLRPVRHRKL